LKFGCIQKDYLIWARRQVSRSGRVALSRRVAGREAVKKGRVIVTQPCIGQSMSADDSDRLLTYREFCGHLQDGVEGGLPFGDGLTRARPPQGRYKIAIGLTGEPVATASRSGAITHRNDHCLNSAHIGARTEKSR
jgi:hypothetical protein